MCQDRSLLMSIPFPDLVVSVFSNLQSSLGDNKGWYQTSQHFHILLSDSVSAGSQEAATTLVVSPRKAKKLCICSLWDESLLDSFSSVLQNPNPLIFCGAWLLEMEGIWTMPSSDSPYFFIHLYNFLVKGQTYIHSLIHLVIQVSILCFE